MVKEPIRVLQVANMNRSSGVASFLMNYYRHLDHSKVQFDFIHQKSDQDNYLDEIESLGGKVYIVPSYKNIVSYNKHVANILENSSYSILHAHEAVVSLFSLKQAKRKGVPIRIAHSHNPCMTKKWKDNVVKTLRPFFSSYGTNFWACSMESGVFLFGENKRKDINVIPNAIDAKKFSYNLDVRNKMRKELDLENNVVIGHIGRFNIQKNHDFLIDIFSDFYKKEPSARLLLIGEGELLLSIKDKVNSKGLEKVVHFLGVRSDIPQLLQSMDIFVFPSKFEGLGIALIEAQASGLTCYSSNEVIPKEVEVTTLLNFIPLSLSAEEWVKIICSNSNKREKRKNQLEDIRRAGYDIQIEAKKLEVKYIDLYHKAVSNKLGR